MGDDGGLSPAPIIVLHRAVHFNRSAFELPQVAHMVEIVREHHSGKRASVEVPRSRGGSPLVPFHMEDRAADPLSLSDILVRVRE
jgi:hypothetical protein